MAAAVLPSPSPLSLSAVAAIVLAVLAVAAAVAVWVTRARQNRCASQASPTVGSGLQTPAATAAPLRNWVVVGTGLAAAACARALDPRVRAAFSFRQADDRAGGRALSTTQALVPVSTATAPREFAAWIFEPFVHTATRAMVAAVGATTLNVPLVSDQSFIALPGGDRAPFGQLPPCDAPASPTQSLAECAGDDPRQAALWFAHTGVHPADAPRARATTVRQLALPRTALVVAGYGWQDVVLRGIGTTPVVYNRSLEAVEVVHNQALRLTYASGDAEVVQGAVLTLPPPAMLRVRNLPPATAALIRRSFVTLTAGVVYLAFAAQDVWWPAAGWTRGCVSTATPLGRVFVVSRNELRCVMSGDADVAVWADAVVRTGNTDAARRLARDFLSTAFGRDDVPLPSALAFRPWPGGMSLWSADVEDVVAARDTLRRPWGRGVPVWWASADVSSAPGWAEGAVAEGEWAAQDVARALPALGVAGA